MDIEQLSKSQIVLLTVFICFITSIATGIVTVSLMDQAPPVIAQSVSRVIEKTIETVASSTSKGQSAATVITQQKTVVVRESDLISQAVAKTELALVRLTTSSADSPRFLGLGVVLNASGTIATDESIFGDGPDAIAVLGNGTHVRAFVTARDAHAGIAYLTPATSTVEGKVPSWKPIAISVANPVLGESVIALSGKTISRIAAGIITALLPGKEDAPNVIDTGISQDSITAGSPLIDTEGNLLGISTAFSRSASASGFLVSPALMKAGGQ